MTDKKNTPKFSENKVDDLIAGYGRDPAKKDMDMIESMAAKEMMKQKVRKQLQEAKQNRQINRGKGRNI